MREFEQTLLEITHRIRQGRYPNEQAISQGVVLRLLQALGWDTWDTSKVWPEFQTGEGRADFALCHPPSKAQILIEVKQPGRAEDAVRQALEYAFHTGVPFIVLTDGQTWSFYLPAEAGSYEDRRVYKLDLFEREVSEAAATLERYVGRSRVESGVALQTAREEYRSRNRRAEAQAEIPAAWRELVEKGDESLVELLTGAVESKTGIRPEADDVAEFLLRLGRVATSQVSPMPSEQKVTVRTPAGDRSEMPSPSRRHGTVIVAGHSFEYRTAVDAMVTVLRELALTDPTFLQRCAEHPAAQGRKRRYIARTAEELYPDRADLRDFRESLPGGWLVATNLNNVLKKAIIRLAAEVAGLQFGRDVVVEF